ncbi:MAG: bile acid:sodium symporter [Opitutales bacterium]
MKSWVRQQGFIFGLIAAVLLALLGPVPAGEYGVLRPEFTTKLGVACIFFLQGLGLATRQMLAGCRPLRLHVFCIAWNFLLFPALTGALLLPLSLFVPSELRLGLWMLSILPTTVASAAALTASAGGAVPQAIFASIVSNVLAVFLVPVLAAAYLATGPGVEVPLLPVFTKLCLIVLLPLLFGQLVRRLLNELARKISAKTRWLNQLIILYLVYLAFAGSVQSGLLSQLKLVSLLIVCSVVVVLLLLSSYLVWRSAEWLRFDFPERTAAFFCASQKSLATGLPLLASILVVTPLAFDPAVWMIPLLLFHPLQLLLGALMTSRLAVERF